MVESGREYVLQWPGHAAYVTERFSGLLARQTLVDVTLICDEQKLRVHKLVLASCSLYFEEILAEDLGPEPIILLRDLNFSILKAMIEFMYCSETTVSHVHLPSLLAAARLFKVKELESLVEKMVGSVTPDHNDNNKGEYLPKDVGSSGSRVNGVISSEDNGIRVSFTNKNNGQSNYDDDEEETESSDLESDRNCVDESISGTLSDSPTDRCLYEDLCVPKSKTHAESLHRNGEIKEDSRLRQELEIESLSDSSSTSSTLDSEANCEKDSEPTRLYERCCEFVGNGRAKNEESSTQLYLTPDSTDNEINRVGQCSKVYTHKKRKVNGDNTSKRYAMHIAEKTLPQPHASNRIDLADDSSNDETPITLKTNLDSESSDYLLSFNTESIQSIVGCSLSDYCPSGAFEMFNARADNVGEEEEEGEEEGNRPPVLRRSVRLNQQESEESSIPLARVKTKIVERKKSRSPSVSSAIRKLFPRNKRKNKELERRVPNVKVIVTSTSTSQSSTRKNNHSRPLRRTSKLSDRCTNKNHLSKNSSSSSSGNDKPKTTDKLTSNSQHEASAAANECNNHANENPSRSSTRAPSVNRALWGDMSDVAEDGELHDEFLEYSPSAEIPFAVGLLPLRAALERMQATLDHQPRKTRSSVASSTKQDSTALSLSSSNSNHQQQQHLKRKNSPTQQHDSTPPLPTKKQNTTNAESEQPEENNSSAVCHIQIRTSSPCATRPRKRSLSDGAATSLGHTATTAAPAAATFNGRP